MTLVEEASPARFERMFRLAASLDVDKSDRDRYHEFLDHELLDLLLRAEAAAKANARDVIQWSDLPITKGLQEQMHEFRRIERESGVAPLLDRDPGIPPLDLAVGVDVEQRLPEVAGGLTVALARAFRILDPDVKNPMTPHWDRAFALFDLLL